MNVENNPDFKSIWQLAHDWASEQSDQTDPAAISSELRLAIDRLIRAKLKRDNLEVYGLRFPHCRTATRRHAALALIAIYAALRYAN